MKRIASFCILILLADFLFAQQDPQFSHDMFNNMAINPGYAGSVGQMEATFIRRDQWIGFEGAPATTVFSLNGAFKTFGPEKSGIGLTLIQDKLGFDKNFSAKAAYAYRRPLGPGKLGIGLELGIMNKALTAEWKFPDTQEQRLASKDGYTAFDMGIGAFFNTRNFWAGLSVSHVNQAKIKFQTESGAADPIPYVKRHYYLSTGYNLELPIALLEFKPSALVKSDGASTQFSVNAMLLYNKFFWGGVTYRNLDAFIALAGIELRNGIKIGLAYDMTMTKINAQSTEVYLSYTFDILPNKGNPQRYKSVRFL